METTNSTPLIVISAAFVITSLGFLIRYLWKKRMMKKELKEAILKVEQEIEKRKEQERFLRIDTEVLIREVSEEVRQFGMKKLNPAKFAALDERINERIEIIDERTKELTSLSAPSPRWFWKRYVNHMWFEDSIPSRFLKPPKETIEFLQEKLKKLNNLFHLEVILVKAYQRNICKNKPWTNKQGEIVHISKIELYFKEEIAVLRRMKNEAQDAKNMFEMEAAIKQLERAILYVETRQSETSLGIGEGSIIGKARNLDFQKVKAYSKKALNKVAKLESKGAEPTSIIDFCLTASLDLEQNYEDWAKEIFDKQLTFDDILKYLKELEESRKVKITACDEFINDAITLFKDTIPNVWGAADWKSLKTNLSDVKVILHKIEVIRTNLMNVAKTIDNLEVRFQDIMAEENEFEENYGDPIKHSAKWADALVTWEKDVPKLWANGDFDSLEAALSKLDKPLKQRAYKVKNRLYEAAKASGVKIQGKSTYKKPDKSYLAKSPTPSMSLETAPVEIPSPNGHKGKLSGSTVTLRSPYGDGATVDVDSSRVRQMLKDGYTKVISEGEKKKHTK